MEALAGVVLVLSFASAGLVEGVRELVPASGASRLKLMMFGDSLLDTGNTNFVPGARKLFQANWLPYGQDFVPRGPTGRFSNGKIFTDFMADAGGIPTPPPSQQPGASKANGLNFAVVGAVIRSTTNELSAFSVPAQIQWFTTALPSLNVSNSTVAVFSVGSNDYKDFFQNRPRGWKNLINVTADDIISRTLASVQVLYSLGVKNYVLINMGALGCTPAARAVVWWNRGCFTDAQNAATWHNARMDLAVASLRTRLPNANILVLDILQAFYDTATAFGIPIASRACCGWKPPTYGNSQCGVGRFDLCPNVNQTLFWDSVHPTERTVRKVFEFAWAGGSRYIRPFNLSSLYRRIGVLTG